jgi:hypothetical protein
MRPDLDRQNVLLGFGRARQRIELVRATLDPGGWQETPMGILKASRQAEQGFQLEFAHRARNVLGDRLTVIDAADHDLLRGPVL